MIENEIIQEIRNKSDIVDIIGGYIQLSKKGKNYFGVCPFHDDTNPSMSVSKEKQIYTCFSCGATGNVITFVMDYEKVSYKEALQVLASKLGMDLKISKGPTRDERPYKIFETLDKFYQNNLHTSLGIKAIEYLKERKLNDDIIKEFGIGLSISGNNKATKLLIDKGFNENELVGLGITNKNDYGYNDVFINRIMFPLWNETGNTIGYSGRIYDNSDDAKYINTKETTIFKKGMLLYNYHRVKEAVRETKSVIVMEGFMDVIRAYSAGINNAIALMGTAMTSEQAKLIKKLSDEVYLCFDGDAAGEKATLVSGNELLKIGVNVKIIRIEEGDPDSYILKHGVDKFKALFNSPMSLMDFKIEYYKKDLNLSNSVDLTKYVKELMKEVSLINDKILLELTLKRISELVNVSYDTLKGLISKELKEPVEIKTIPVKVRKEMVNKYEKAERIVLYYMLNDEQVIIKYRNKIPSLPSINCRYLFHEILNYYEKYKTINVADFITFLNGKKELIETVGGIIEINYDEEYDVKQLDEYIKVLTEYAIKKEIERLKMMLKEEMNLSRKAEIAQKITELKIRSEEDVN